jgi:ElaB/YqjD/DUF883 family membrane-anchored ribosome-binding protein
LRKVKKGIENIGADSKEKLQNLKTDIENIVNGDMEDKEKAIKEIRSKIDTAIQDS